VNLNWKTKEFRLIYGEDIILQEITTYTGGADKSLARPGRKQATATEDFDFDISYL
jgi:hypothetical protein